MRLKNKKIDPKEDKIIISSSTIVPFQEVPIPFTPEDDFQVSMLQRCQKEGLNVFMVPMKNPEGAPSIENCEDYGVEMKVARVMELPNGQKNAFLVGERRVKVTIREELKDATFMGCVKYAPDRLWKTKYPDFAMTMGVVEDLYDKVKGYFSEITNIQMAPPPELMNDKKTFLNFIIITSPLDYQERKSLLEEADLYKRAEKLLPMLIKVKKQIDFRQEIYEKASEEIKKEQRDHFLRAEMRTIQQEIGDGDEEDIAVLAERAEKKNWPDEMKGTFEKELRKLRRYNPNSPDYAVQFTYLETLLNLPWNDVTETAIDLDKLEKDLDRDHYGLEKIKERIMEHVAVLKLRNDMRSPILCLYGPPGVGKTSLCKSIADSIGRDYARISLGALHDETEIRGHRRTYIGALPGRIISAIEKLKTNNPVFVLDEIDKIGNDHRGDPAQALLEVLDPEQNSRFHDNYLDVDYDLSKIFFIATANNLSTISAPLLDRMELLEITGYLPEEKLEIAKRHLLPKQLENHGFDKDEISLTDEAINALIDSYTRESGVRKLEKMIAAVLRKVAVLKAKGLDYPTKIDEAEARKLLGKEEVLPEKYEGDLPVGVVPGLAWTPVGGEILYFESSLSKGKGEITLTGNMGDVMKESAAIALKWVKAHADELGIDAERFAKTDVHLHVPEGAVPKDGPSAGITMTTSVAGSFMNRKVKDGVAMTGEATLSGKVLPVGGVKEKILAAKRAGITDIVLSEKNQRDIEEIPSRYVDGLTFHYVTSLQDVLAVALQPA